MGAPYIYDISRLRVKDLHSATYIYVVRRLRVKPDSSGHSRQCELPWPTILSKGSKNYRYGSGCNFLRLKPICLIIKFNRKLLKLVNPNHIEVTVGNAVPA